MVDVKEAVRTAADYLADLFAEEDVSDIRLEEVELSEDVQTWHVTLSFLRRVKAGGPVTNALSMALGPHLDRDYKVLTVRADDGSVTSVKIRQLA